MTFAKTLLSDGTARTANLVVTAVAEAGGADGWDNGATGATATPAQSAAGTALSTPFAADVGAGAPDNSWARSIVLNPGAAAVSGLTLSKYYLIDPVGSSGGGHPAITAGSSGHVLSLFVRRGPTTPSDRLYLTLNNDTTGGGTAAQRTVVMLWSATDQVWTCAWADTGWMGRDTGEVYADGWHRIVFFWQRRQFGSAVESAVAANLLTCKITCESSKILHVWGLLWESQSAVTLTLPTALTNSTDATGAAFTSTTQSGSAGAILTLTNATAGAITFSITDGTYTYTSPSVSAAGTFAFPFMKPGSYTVSNSGGAGTCAVTIAAGSSPSPKGFPLGFMESVRPSPYLTGMQVTFDKGSNGPLSFSAGRRQDSSTGIFQVSMGSSPTATMVLCGSAGGPWEVIQSVTQADVAAATGSKAYFGSGTTLGPATFPQMRLAIQVWSAGTLGAWYAE